MNAVTVTRHDHLAGRQQWRPCKHVFILRLTRYIDRRFGKAQPLCSLSCSIRYEQNIRDIKAAAARKMGVPVENMLLFWHKKELTAAYDTKTLLDMNMHTGFSLKGYDTVSHVVSV